MRHVVRRHVEGCMSAAGRIVVGEPYEGQHVRYVWSRLGNERVGRAEHGDCPIVCVF
jgi:hypothetical protein